MDEFWGHCSGLQVWFENNYNTRLLHYNLAFPLLEKLYETGDLLARKVFKEEIGKRLSNAYPSVVLYLINEGLIDYLGKEEWEVIIVDPELKTIPNLIKLLSEPNECDILAYIKILIQI